MRFPAYVLLPILGAVALTAAVLGSWLWPEPTAPSPSAAPPALPAPVATEAPAPLPPPRPPPARRAARPTVAAPVVAQPQSGAVMPTQPVETPAPVTPSPLTDMSPDMRGELQQKWSSLRGRAADLAERGVQELERQRVAARVRGDQAEVERLDAIINQQWERVERLRAIQAQAPSERPEFPSPEQAGPPLE